MKTETYLKEFEGYDEAFEWCVTKNGISKKDIFCVVPGPSDNFAVVDIMTAIELELGYVVGTSRLHFVTNPF